MPPGENKTSSSKTVYPPVPPRLAGKFTPKQWARHQELGKKLQKFASDGQGRPLSRVAVKGRRIIVLTLCGSAFLIAGILSLVGILHLSNDPAPGDPGAGHRFGHGGDILAMLIGIVLLGVSLKLLIDARAARGTKH